MLDPFSGAGTTGLAAHELGRTFTGIDTNPTYHEIAVRRFTEQQVAAQEGRRE
ncbi:DNA methyltransferase [Prauserella oleivorans]